MTYEEILTFFEPYKLIRERRDSAVCYSPARPNEKQPSVHIFIGANGTPVVYDHGDAGKEGTQAVLEAVGLSWSALYEDSDKGSSSWIEYATGIVRSRARKYNLQEPDSFVYEKRYNYSNIETGGQECLKLRFTNPKTGNKTFLWGWLIEKDGKPFFITSGTDGKYVDRHGVIYGNIARIRSAIENGETIFTCEGEKDVDTLESYGFTAFTVGSSGDMKRYSDVCAKVATNANIVILGDWDDSGKVAAAYVLEVCKGTADTVKVVFPDKERDKADVTDYFQELDKTVNEFKKLVDETNDNAIAKAAKDTEKVSAHDVGIAVEVPPVAEGEPGKQKKKIPHIAGIDASDLVKLDLEPIRYAVDGIIPEGLTLITARPKQGKSYLMLQTCFAVVKGIPVLGRNTKKGSVVYFDLEMSENAVHERIKNTQGEVPPGLTFIFRDALKEANGGKMPIIGEGFEDILEDQIQTRENLSMIVIDTIVRILPKIPKGAALYQFEADTYEKIEEIGRKYHIPIVCVHHLNKGDDPDDRMSQVSGSNGVTGTADSIVVLTREKRMSNVTLMTVMNRHGVDFERSLEFKNGLWTDLGDGAEAGTDDAAKIISEYESSDIPKAIEAISESIEKPWEGRPGQIISKAADCGFPLIVEPKTLGYFLTRLRPVFLKNNIQISSRPSGNSTIWTIQPAWKPLKSESAYAEDQDQESDEDEGFPFG